MSPRINRLFVFKALNIAVLLASVIACIFVSSEAGKHADKNIFFIAPKINDSAFYFDIDETEKLQAASNAGNYSYLSLGKGNVSASVMNSHSRIIRTNSDYIQLNNIRFAHGGAWSGAGEKENVAIVNEPLAWNLYGGVGIVDMQVNIYNETYTIVGVIAQESISPEDGAIYVPMNPAPGERRISGVYLKITDYNRLGTPNDIGEAFRDIKKNPGDYYITDINRFVENIGLNHKLLIVFAGIYAAAIIVINSYKLLRRSKINRKSLLLLAGVLVLDVVFIVLLLRGVLFEAWIPHGGGSRFADILSAVTNNGFLPPGEYLTDGLKALAELNRYANIALVAGTVALFNFVFVHKARHGVNVY